MNKMGGKIENNKRQKYDAPLTRLQGAGPTGVAGGAVSSRVEGGQSNQVRHVTGQVGEVDTCVWDENHFDLLSLVLLVSLPVVNLQHRKKPVTGSDSCWCNTP